MLGKDFYKLENGTELSSERLKSLVLFYAPLIGNDALALYQNLFFKGSTAGFMEISELLEYLNMNVDIFEDLCGKLNEYRLMKTLKKDDHYIFQMLEPMTMKKFVKDSLMVREFILKTSGRHYQELIADIYEEEKHRDYEDVSKKPDLEILNSWSEDDETYLSKKKTNSYSFNTIFDINVFLKNVSVNLLPMRFRNEEILKQIATLGDLYGISYDRMKSFLPKIINYDNNTFDINKLRYACMSSSIDYRSVDMDLYNVPCVSYLMSLQDGKEVTRYDKQIIYNLSNEYHLSVPVINVLLRHGLKNCDNRLIEKYLYPIASDLHRNNIQTSKMALERLEKGYSSSNRKEEVLPSYSQEKNKKMSPEEIEKLLALKDKK